MRRLTALVVGITLLVGVQVRAEPVNHARAWASDNYATTPPNTVDNWAPLDASALVSNTAGNPLQKSRQAASRSRLVYDDQVEGDVLRLGAKTLAYSSINFGLEKATARAYWYDTLTVTPHTGMPQPSQILLTFELTGSMKVQNTATGLATANVVVNGDAGASVKLLGYNPSSNPLLTGSWATTNYVLTPDAGTSSLSMTDFIGTLTRLVDVSTGSAAISVMLESESSVPRDFNWNGNAQEVSSNFADTLTITKITNPDGSWPVTWDYKFDSNMVPEPSTFVHLAGLALLGLVGYRWKRRR